MSDAKGNSRSTTPQGDREVLVNLPHTRPQRSSPRRAAAREAAAGTTPKKTTAARPAARSRIGGGGAPSGSRKPAASRTPGSKPRSAPKRPAGSGRRSDAAPRQGFEADSDMNGSVQPPGGAELVASAAEIVGELAKVGLSAGERLLKDAFSRLPRS